MKEQNSNNDSKDVVEFVADNGKFKVSYDPQKVMDEIIAAGPQAVAGFVGLALRTVVHRRSDESRPATGSGHEETSAWLLACSTSTGNGGSFKVSKADKDKAQMVWKQYKMAPEKVGDLFVDTYGQEFPASEEALASFYRDKRAAEAKSVI